VIMEQNNVIKLMDFVAQRTMDIAGDNSVLGEPIVKDGMTIIPVSKVSVSFAGGGADIADKKRTSHPSGGGAKVDVVPMSFLVIKDGKAYTVKVEATEKSNVKEILDFITTTAKQLFSKKAEDK